MLPPGPCQLPWILRWHDEDRCVSLENLSEQRYWPPDISSTLETGDVIAEAGSEVPAAHSWLALHHPSPAAPRSVPTPPITVTISISSQGIFKEGGSVPVPMSPPTPCPQQRQSWGWRVGGGTFGHRIVLESPHRGCSSKHARQGMLRPAGLHTCASEKPEPVSVAVPSCPSTPSTQREHSPSRSNTHELCRFRSSSVEHEEHQIATPGVSQEKLNETLPIITLVLSRSNCRPDPDCQPLLLSPALHSEHETHLFVIQVFSILFFCEHVFSVFQTKNKNKNPFICKNLTNFCFWSVSLELQLITPI